MKLYIIQNNKNYYNAKTNTWVTKIHFATTYRSFTDAEKIKRQWKLEGDTIELSKEDVQRLMHLYNHASFDFCLATDFLIGKILSYEGQIQGFTKCNTKRIEKLLKELKNELKPSFEWLDQYDDNAPETTEPIRELHYQNAELLGQVNLVDLVKVNKYLKTKVKQN